MELITPGIGLIFWTSLVFLSVLVVLRAVAWKPIVSALTEREQSIREALKSAEHARQEMQLLTNKNHELLKEAQAEKDSIVKEAKEAAEKIRFEASEKANAEAHRLLAQAQEAIQAEKNAALAEVKQQIAKFSVEIAERLLKHELSDKKAQTDLVKAYLNETKIN